MLATLHFFINGRFVNKECCSKKKFKLIRNNNIMILNLIKKAVSFGDADCNKKKDEGDNDRPSTTDIELKGNIYDLIRTIKDPEKPATLEELLVVYEEGVLIKRISDRGNLPFVIIEFNPTVPHCSLATLIGLCIRIKLQRCLPQPLKVDIYIKKGAHDTEDEINKQINDKERIAAAMENPNLKELVEQCILEEE